MFIDDEDNLDDQIFYIFVLLLFTMMLQTSQRSMHENQENE